jgi:hypothetical protein
MADKTDESCNSMPFTNKQPECAAVKIHKDNVNLDLLETISNRADNEFNISSDRKSKSGSV